jgi:hypothetical protein
MSEILKMTEALKIFKQLRELIGPEYAEKLPTCDAFEGACGKC